MMLDKLNRLWLLATGILILIILMGSLVIWFGRDRGQEIIFTTQNSDIINSDQITVDGAVSNPGTYPLNQDDTINDLVKAAGGPNQNADLAEIKIFVPQTGVAIAPQKININRAEVWLLQALPGIGEIRAQSIVDYRSQNGPFKNIEEIMRIPGLNQPTFETIKGFITISE
jgi:competence protein ComEA